MSFTKAWGYAAKGQQRYIVLRSPVQNIDNGSGTTADFPLIANLVKAAVVVKAEPVYTEATDTSGAASATWSLGTTAGGVDVVAATALEVLKSVGDAGTAGTVLKKLAAGDTLFYRHTGIAATEAGQYYLQVTLMLEP